MTVGTLRQRGNDKVDAVIVGAGAAGAILAARLSAQKRKVVILEIGPGWKQQDLYSSHLWSRRIKWGGAPVELAGKHPTSYNFEMGWGSGGSAIHHYGQWPRLHESDFRSQSLFGRGVDWPIGYDDLRPWYDSVQERVGVSGDHTREPWRPPGAPYPLPPLATFRQAEVLAEGFRKIGVRVGPMPAAILSQPYKGRPACIYDGWCDAGCPTGALAQPLVSDLPAAVKNGARLVNGAEVTRVLSSDDGKRVLGVEYAEASGMRLQIHADVVILANNCIQGSRLLLNSATAKHPDGLANRSGTVGRYLMMHFAAGVKGLFDVDMQNHLGATACGLLGQDGYGQRGGSYSWLIAPAHKMANIVGMANADTSLFGAALHDFMRKAVRGLGSMVAIGEQMPRAENRVSLSATRDAQGLPLARWENAFDERELQQFRAMREEGLRVMQAAGAQQVWAPETFSRQHIGGGLRMGKSGADSVCDSYGRSHDLPNLVLAGGGLLPTEGAVNPTFTVHALTERTAAHLNANWRSYAA